MRKLKIRTILFLFCIIFYKILLEKNYYFICKYIAGYEGFKYNLSKNTYFISWIILILFFPVLIRINRDLRKGKFSGYFLTNISLISFIPFLSMMPYSEFDNNFIMATILFYFILFNIQYSKLLTKNLFFNTSFHSIKNSKIILVFIKIICFVTIFYMSYKVNFRIFIKFNDVYRYRQQDLNINKFLEYLWGNLKIGINLFLLIALNRKQYILSLFFTMLIFLIYGVYGEKFILLLLVITYAVHYFFSYKSSKNVIFIFILVMLMGLLEILTFGSFLINNFLIRRLFFFTNRIQEVYFHYFSGHENKYLEQKYELSHVIGELYFGGFETGANSGLISDAVANFGYFGIILYPIVLGILMYKMNIMFVRKNIKIVYLFSVYFSIILISSFLKTGILTHGILFGLLIIILDKNRR